MDLCEVTFCVSVVLIALAVLRPGSWCAGADLLPATVIGASHLGDDSLRYGRLLKLSPAAHEKRTKTAVPSCHGRAAIINTKI